MTVKIIKRVLEAGIALYSVLIAAIVITGGFAFHALGVKVSCLHLVSPFGILCVLVLVRLIIGRNKNALLVLLSSAFTALLFLYSLEALLYFKDKQAMASPAAVGVPAAPAPADAPPAAVNPAPAADPDFDPLKNDGKNWTWGHAVHGNSWGFREREVATPKPEGRLRVMVLGDSLTWGAGLDEDQRYSRLAEAMVKEALPGRDIEVLNFGLPAAPTTRERDILREYGPRVFPDLVVLGFCYNDPQPRSANWSKERARLEDFYSIIASLRYLGLSRSYRFIIDRVDTLAARRGWIPTWQEALDRAYRPESPEWKAYSRALADINAWARENTGRAPVFLVLVQNLHRENAGSFSESAEGRWFEAAAREAAAQGFTVADPSHFFAAGFSLAELPVNPLDSHPSAKCNRAYARSLAPVIAPMLEKARP